jgi:hypothetical protein
MTPTFKKTAFAIGLAVATSFAASTAFAGDVVVQFDPSTVQYGYSDGYWSKTHEWHTWEKPEYVQTYRTYPKAQYNDWVHTRDSNQGWIEIQK